MSEEKFKKEELYNLSAVEIYKLVLEGKSLKRFPIGFWQRPEAIDNAISITKYLIEDYLKLSDDELKKQLSQKLFMDNGLRNMLNHCFNGGPHNVINLVYAKKFNTWEFNTVPKGYWDNEENIIKTTKWLIEEKLKLNDDEIKEQLSVHLFRDNGLRGMLNSLNNSPYKAVELAYPGRFKPWEFNIVPNGFWNEDTALQATKWLIEDKLKLSKYELNSINLSTFINNGLGGMLYICFNYSYNNAIREYLNKF